MLHGERERGGGRAREEERIVRSRAGGTQSVESFTTARLRLSSGIIKENDVVRADVVTAERVFQLN